jgi:hypothetical protein
MCSARYGYSSAGKLWRKSAASSWSSSFDSIGKLIAWSEKPRMWPTRTW